MMARADASIFAVSREIASTAGLPFWLAVLAGGVAGAALGVVHFQDGGTVWGSVLAGAIWMVVFSPMAILGLALGGVIGGMGAKPRPARSPAALELLFARSRAAAWTMALGSLALSLHAMLG